MEKKTKTLIEQITQLYDEHILLTISDLDIKRAKSASQNYSNQTGKNYAYQNRLVRDAFVKYLQANLLNNNGKITVNLPETWEFVNGSAVTVDIEFKDDKDSENAPGHQSVQKMEKFILIPNDNLDIEEFTIPQEWVDIPTWAGDYYLPVQVNLEANYLHLWGYISQQNLRKKAEYNQIFRNYYIHQNDLISDLDLLLSTIIFCQEEKDEVKSLPEFLPNVVEDLINQLSKPSPYSPRLQVNFEQWGALLNNEEILQKLAKARLKLPEIPPTLVLSNWLNNINNIIDEGWETIEQFLNRQTSQVAFRGIGKTRNGDSLIIRNNVARFIKAQKQFSFPATMSEEEKLVQVFKKTQQEHIRWEAVEYLWKLNPFHPELPVLKIFDLGVQLQGNHLGVMVGIFPKEQEKLAIFLRVYPLGSTSCLPRGVKLCILDENDELFMEAVSRERDNWIQLYFTADKGDSLSFGVTLNSATMLQRFLV